MDANFLYVDFRQEVSGLFTRFFSDEGRHRFDALPLESKKKQTIIPDLLSSNHPDGSLFANSNSGPQM
jgi:hypothetical protein